MVFKENPMLSVFMRKALPYFFFITLCSSCVSNKPAYDTAQKPSQFKQSERNIAYLKNISKIEDNNYDFISSQMQTLIRNYKRMKSHLSNIEDKLDVTLKKLEAYRYKSLLGSKSIESSPQVEDEIRIKNKEDEEVILGISKLDDYKYIMGELVAGDYNTSESETKRALKLLKNKLDKAQNSLSQDKKRINRSDRSSEMKALSDSEEMQEDMIEEENFDEDSLIEEEVTDDVNLFSQEEIKESEEDNSSFLLGKQLFENKSYEMAISELQKYRNENPEGQHYLEATFYIGQAFEKLQMPIEAKIFFQEIVKTDSDSLWAVKAKKEIKE